MGLFCNYSITQGLTHVCSQFYSVLDGDVDMIFMHVDNPGGTVTRFFASPVKEMFSPLFNSSTTAAVSLKVLKMQDLSSWFRFVLT